MAAVVDHLAMLTYITLKANGAKNARKPAAVPRPREGAAFVSAAPVHREVGHAPGNRAEGPVRAGSWAEAAAALAGVPGVKVQVQHG